MLVKIICDVKYTMFEKALMSPSWKEDYSEKKRTSAKRERLRVGEVEWSYQVVVTVT